MFFCFFLMACGFAMFSDLAPNKCGLFCVMENMLDSDLVGEKPTGAVNMSSLIKVLSVRVLNESISFNFVVIVVVFLLPAFFH